MGGDLYSNQERRYKYKPPSITSKLANNHKFNSCEKGKRRINNTIIFYHNNTVWRRMKPDVVIYVCLITTLLMLNFAMLIAVHQC